MRVAYNALLLDAGEGSGVHRTLRETARALAQTRPDDAELLFYARPAAPPDALPAPAKSDAGAPVRRANAPGYVRWRAGRIFWEQLRLPTRVVKDAVDVLHAPGYVMPRLSLVPCVATVHDLFALNRPILCTAANRSHFRRQLPTTLARAARVAVPAEAVRAELLDWARAAAANADTPKHRAIDPERLKGAVRVIPWGVSPFWRPPTPEERDDATRRLGLPPRFFLVAARAEPKKNLVTALQAWFAATAARQLPHRLVMVGPKGWGVTAKLDRLIADLGAEDRVLRPGYVSDADLRSLYGLADALLFPSVAEGFGLPVLEAMACGCPVAASDLPVLLEVAGRENAVFAPPGDRPAWRVLLENLAGDEKSRRRLSEKGLLRARAFSWERCARAYWDLYREVHEEYRQRG